MGNICSGSSVGPWWLSYWACQFSHGALKMISYSEWLCKLPECIMLYYVYMGPHWLHHHSLTGKIALGGFRHTLNDYIIVFVLPLHFPKKKKNQIWKAVALLQVKYQCKVIIDFFSCVRCGSILSGGWRISFWGGRVHLLHCGCTKKGAGGRAHYES